MLIFIFYLEQFKQKMKAHASKIEALEPMRIYIRPGSKLKEIAQNEELTGVVGSFRKLEVD